MREYQLVNSRWLCDKIRVDELVIGVLILRKNFIVEVRQGRWRLKEKGRIEFLD